MNAEGCLICGGSELAPRLTGCQDLYLGTPWVVDFVCCMDCGLVQQHPVPQDTRPFYPTDYPMHTPRGDLIRLARQVLIHGVYYRPKQEDASATLLDFGCGDGEFLASIKDRVGRRIGLEDAPGQAASVAARLGIETVHCLDPSTVQDESVDILTAHFVLEHLTDLRGTFASWRRVVRPGGRLHIAVPNLDCFEARLFGRRWHGLDPPRHISFPAGSNLTRLAATAGFEVVRHRNAVFPNTWSASLVATMTGRHRNLLFLAMTPLGAVLSTLFPQSTSVYLLRRNS